MTEAEIDHSFLLENSALSRSVHTHNTGHTFISDNARVHLGDVYTINRDLLESGTSDERRTTLFNLLHYDGLGLKRNQISSTHSTIDAFSWIEQTSFPTWLESDSAAPFWIMGKPGSGKSTLMKFLSDSFSTYKHLNAGTKKWSIVHFFFDYRAGRMLANHPLGMVKALMHQLSLRHRLLAVYFEEHHPRLSQDCLSIYIDVLAEALVDFDTRVCAFIDGLDEYDGNMWDLYTTLDTLQTHTGMRLCLSSRHESAFENMVESAGDRALLMQDHNAPTIRACIKHKISRFEAQHCLLHGRFPVVLQDQVAEKAQGIILWANLVVDQIIEGFSGSSAHSADDAFKSLAAMPLELELLYARILDKISEKYKGEATIILYLLVEHEATFNEKPCNSLQLYQAFDYLQMNCLDGQRPPSLIEQHVCEGRLKGLLGGLIDFVHEDNCRGVRLLHKSLSSYLVLSSWLECHLPRPIVRFFPDLPWKRIAIDLMATAARDSPMQRHVLMDLFAKRFDHATTLIAKIRIRDHSAFRQSSGGQESVFTLSYRSWSALILHCIDQFFEFDAKFYDDSGKRNVGLDFPSGASHFALLHLLRCDVCIYHSENWYRRARIQRLFEADQLDLLLDLTHHRFWNFHQHLQRRLQFLNAEIAADFLDLVVLEVSRASTDCHSQANPYGPLLDIFGRQGFTLEPRHICMSQIILERSPFIGVLLGVVSRYPPHPPPQFPFQNHDRDCPHRHSAMPLAHHWLYMTPEDEDKGLTLLLKLGVDFKASFQHYGSPIHAILDQTSGENSLSTVVAFRKFVAAAAKGLRPDTVCPIPTALSCARSMHRRAKLKGIFQRSGSMELYLKFLAEAIRALEEYDLENEWGLCVHEMREGAGNLSRLSGTSCPF